MAKITIQKKNRVNPFEELSALLKMPGLEAAYPVRTLEPWRRFDPSKLIQPMTESLRQGMAVSRVTLADTVDSDLKSNLHSASQWKNLDELFLQKAKNNLKLFEKKEACEFFENLAVNSAGEEGLSILRIPKNKSFEEIPTVEISAPEAGKFHSGVFYLYAEESSKATINLVKKSGAFDVSIVYVYLEKNSEVYLRYLDENNQPSQGVHFVKYFQEENSHSKSGIYSLCASDNRKVFIENNLSQKAQAEYMGIFLGRRAHVDHDFSIVHNGNYSVSNLLFKMSVMDQSYGVFWGEADIVAGTQGCEAYQQNKNLILGNNSRIDAIPRLNIHTENVVAAHGSATGEISEEEIFYMMSRGLGYAEARKLLLRGFFEDVLRRSFEHDDDKPDALLEKIWTNIQTLLGVEIST